jgi:DNA-binding CsgD family transcriptional regulator
VSTTSRVTRRVRIGDPSAQISSKRSSPRAVSVWSNHVPRTSSETGKTTGGGALSESPGGNSVLEATLGALPVPAYTNDIGGFVTWQNDAARAVAGDLRGVHFSKAVPSHELARARETWAAVTLGGETRRRTGSFRAANGDLVRLEVITAPIRTKGRIVGTFGIAIPHDGAPRRPETALSSRQLDVLRLLVQGKSTTEIADALHLAPDTVRNHVQSLLRALGAHTRLEAALVALRDGLVSLDLDEG